MRKRLVLLAAAVAAVTATPAASKFTSTPARSAVAVTVVEQRHLAHNAGALILLKAHTSPNTFIFVDPDKATPEDLASSFNTIQSLRARFGDSMNQDVEAVPKAAPMGAKQHNPNSAQLARMTTYLGALGRSRPKDVHGVGVAKAITVILAAAK